MRWEPRATTTLGPFGEAENLAAIMGNRVSFSSTNHNFDSLRKGNVVRTSGPSKQDQKVAANLLTDFFFFGLSSASPSFAGLAQRCTWPSSVSANTWETYGHASVSPQ